MTLVVAVTGEQSIWMLADRRVSYPNRPPKDDARKIMFLDTIDGQAMLGYAGLGATSLGTEPSDWMARVLRGRNLTLEQSLSVLAEAAKDNLPRHLGKLRITGAASHNIIISTFVEGEPRLYTIDITYHETGHDYNLRFTRHLTTRKSGKRQMPPSVVFGGSGAIRLLGNRSWAWARDLRKMVAVHDQGRISPLTVATALARLNSRVAKVEPTVGSRCIVSWRLKNGGGGYQFFDGARREASSGGLPSIVQGLDIQALSEILGSYAYSAFDAWRRGEAKKFELDMEAIGAEVAQLPDTPDDTLE